MKKIYPQIKAFYLGCLCIGIKMFKTIEAVNLSIAHKRGQEHKDRTGKVYVGSSKLRNRLFMLTKDEFKLIVTKPCYYCGVKPALRVYPSSKKNPEYHYMAKLNGIDRLTLKSDT